MSTFTQKVGLKSNSKETLSSESKEIPSSPPSSSRRTSSSKKRVSFSIDTPLPKDNTLALSIMKYGYVKELGYTQYTINFICHGIEWTTNKRYRDFEKFHRELILQHSTARRFIPVLPQKRWFERQRWFNRFDESFGNKRRISLQEYLRTLAKIPIIRERSNLFREFCSFPKEVIAIDEEELKNAALQRYEPQRTSSVLGSPHVYEYDASYGEEYDQLNDYEEAEVGEAEVQQQLSLPKKDSVLFTTRCQPHQPTILEASHEDEERDSGLDPDYISKDPNKFRNSFLEFTLGVEYDDNGDPIILTEELDRSYSSDGKDTEANSSTSQIRFSRGEDENDSDNEENVNRSASYSPQTYRKPLSLEKVNENKMEEPMISEEEAQEDKFDRIIKVDSLSPIIISRR